MNGRVLIIVGIIILLVGVVGFALFSGILGGGGGDPDVAQQPTEEGGGSIFGQQDEPAEDQPPTPTPVPVVEIIIAVQELPRGFRIPANAIAKRQWPEESLPFNAILSEDEVVNKIARTDIFREQPILSNMLVDDFQNLANDLARVGSDAAAILPNTLVAIAMPIDRLTSVAYAVQDGDRVDVIVSMLFVNVDEGFQSLSPNGFSIVSVTEDGVELSEPFLGRPDTDPFFGTVQIVPSESQRPRLLTQRTVQDALVVHVGEFPDDGRFIGIPEAPPTPTPDPADAPPVGEEGAAGDDEEAEIPTPIPPRPDIVTLGVTPQDAVLLTWAIEAQFPLTLALRSATDTNRVPTEAVTLDYFMQEYRITVPGRRDYSIEPAIRSIRQLDTTSNRRDLEGTTFTNQANQDN